MKKLIGRQKVKIKDLPADRPKQKQLLHFAVRYLVLIAVSIVIALGGELLFQAKLLMLPEEEKGISEINIENALYNGVHNDDEVMDFAENPNGLISIELGGRFVNKFVYKFDFRDNLDSELYIYAENSLGKTERYIVQDNCNKLLDESVVNIGKKVSKIELRLNKNASWGEKYISDEVYYDDEYIYGEYDDEHIFVKGFEIDNTININWYRLGFIFMVCFLGGFLVMERKRLMHRVEIIFLVIAVTAGTFMVFSIPTSKIGFDEEIHFLRAYSLSVYPGAMEMSHEMSRWFVSTEETWPYNVPDSIEEREAYSDFVNQVCSYKETEIHTPSGFTGMYTSGYLAQALMLKLVRKLGCPFILMYQLGRLANLLVYCVVMALAIRKTPCGKWIMAVIGLMPTTLFSACVYSYDATVNCFIYLALACFLNMLLTKDYKISLKDYLIMGAVFMFGCLPKSVYAPLVLLGLILPKRIFKDKKQMWLMKAGIAAAFLFVISANILPTVIAPSDVGDIRGGETSEAGQMSYVLGQPFAYAGVLLKNIFMTLQDYFAGTGVFGTLGHLSVSPVSYLIYSLVIGVICTDTVSEGGREKILSLKAGQRIIIFLVCAFTVALVWTALYISYTVPGSQYIQGVQGRYYIPLLFPVYMIINTNKIQCSIDKSWYNVCVSGISLLILAITIWSCIISPLCL